jgi:hypothetical protein
MQAIIKDSMYQKTEIKEDGITQEVTPEVYKSYQVNIDEVYLIEDKIQMLKQLRDDLQELCDDIDVEIGNEYRKELVKKR